MATTDQKDGKLGRPLRYGSRSSQQGLYAPDVLCERIKHEARVRNIRDNTDIWNFSSVAVDILARHFGVDLTAQEGGNGR